MSARQAMVGVAPELVARILTTGARHDGIEIELGLPEGARYVRVFEDYSGGGTVPVIFLVFEHKSFAEVEHGQKIPIMFVRIRHHARNPEVVTL